MTVRPSDNPPAFRPREFVAEPTDPADERIEVGILIVGAGPAGLACAIRLGQLVQESPELAERLGEVPVAVLEKGKQPGSHIVSGAVVNPRGLRRLFRGQKGIADMPFFGEVEAEAVYFMRPHNGDPNSDPADDEESRQLRGVALPARALARGGGRRGRSDDPARDHGREAPGQGRPCSRRQDRRQGARPERGAASELRAGFGHRRARDDPLRRHAGPPDRRRARDVRPRGREPPGVGARREGGLEGGSAAASRRAHDGLALRSRAKYREFGGSFIYPMGDDMLTLGMVVGLDYRDAELSVHDVLQELKTHRLVRRMLEGGERVGWGAKTIPEGGFVALPRRLHAPGLLSAEMEPAWSTCLRSRGSITRSSPGAWPPKPRSKPSAWPDSLDAGRARDLRRGRAQELHLERPQGRAQHAAGVRARLLRRRGARERDDRQPGRVPAREHGHRA